MVGVNVPITDPIASASFGGWKEFLFGSHHIYGADGVRIYTRAKVVTSRWLAPSPRDVELNFPTPN
jgi:malonate-semialdehyde dehydrogenase (acetylating)/methylmalonate-semialdehyde dehydrogenase